MIAVAGVQVQHAADDRRSRTLNRAAAGRTPFSVSNSRLVSNSQITEPSLVECARSAPSFDPEKRTPGISVGAEISAALQPVPAAHLSGGGGTDTTRARRW